MPTEAIVRCAGTNGTAGRPARWDITGGSSSTRPPTISLSVSAETVARVRPVAAAMSAREGGFAALTISPRTRPRLCSRTLACRTAAVSYTHLRAHETVLDLVCRLLL